MPRPQQPEIRHERDLEQKSGGKAPKQHATPVYKKTPAGPVSQESEAGGCTEQ